MIRDAVAVAIGEDVAGVALAIAIGVLLIAVAHDQAVVVLVYHPVVIEVGRLFTGGYSKRKDNNKQVRNDPQSHSRWPASAAPPGGVPGGAAALITGAVATAP